MEMEVASEDRTAHRAAGFDGMVRFIFLNQVRERASPFKKKFIAQRFEIQNPVRLNVAIPSPHPISHKLVIAIHWWQRFL